MSGIGSLGSDDDRAVLHAYRVLGGVVGIRYADGRRQQTASSRTRRRRGQAPGSDTTISSPARARWWGLRRLFPVSRVALCQAGRRLWRSVDTWSGAVACRCLSAQVVAGSVDVLAPDELEDFTRHAGSVLGGLDGLVANIGGKRGGGLLDSTREDWQATWDLNGGHAVRTVRSAPDSLRPGSSVVIVASISGWKPRFPAQYGAAKASEIYLAGALCQDLAPYGIRVNTVSPGSGPAGAWLPAGCPCGAWSGSATI
ncbi:SDR family oxidoreductase [Streptomyces atratus]|uniref:SDR family oxidoreductase n=1 Tax=Streptomyces atratus TaxID=1893 RepID=UPI0033EA2DC7